MTRAMVVCELYTDDLFEPTFTYAANSIHQGVEWARTLYQDKHATRVRCIRYMHHPNADVESIYDQANVRL